MKIKIKKMNAILKIKILQLKKSQIKMIKMMKKKMGMLNAMFHISRQPIWISKSIFQIMLLLIMKSHNTMESLDMKSIKV